MYIDSTETYSIETFINSKNNEQISYDKLSIFESVDDNIFLSYNILNDYYDELIDSSVYVKLTEEEYSLYKFKPKLLAYKIYGDPEMFFILLFLNNICSIKEFDFRRFRVLKSKDLSKILSSIYNSEYNLLIRKNKEI